VARNGLVVSAATIVLSGSKKIWKDGQSKSSIEMHLLIFRPRSANAASSKSKKIFVKRTSVITVVARSLEWFTVIKLPGVIIVVASNVRCAVIGTESLSFAVTAVSWIYAWTVADTASDIISYYPSMSTPNHA
jgi:hypothetical protein